MCQRVRRDPAAEAAVDFKRLGNILTAAGAVVLIGACFWWFAFYTSVVRDLGRLTGGGANHVHLGVHPGPSGHPDNNDVRAAPGAKAVYPKQQGL